MAAAQPAGEPLKVYWCMSGTPARPSQILSLKATAPNGT